MDCLYYIWLEDELEDMPDIIATVCSEHYPQLDLYLYLN